ncbi:MAG TPA: hypothetical protein VGN00_05445 [Puia sp.]
MERNSRRIQSLVRTAYHAGELHNLADLLEFVPKELLARRLAKSKHKIDLLLSGVGQFTLREIYSVGTFCGLSETEIYIIVEASYFKQKIK